MGPACRGGELDRLCPAVSWRFQWFCTHTGGAHTHTHFIVKRHLPNLPRFTACSETTDVEPELVFFVFFQWTVINFFCILFSDFFKIVSSITVLELKISDWLLAYSPALKKGTLEKLWMRKLSAIWNWHCPEFVSTWGRWQFSLGGKLWN